MKFYQVELLHEGGQSAGFNWFTSERDAKSAAHHWTKDKSVEHAANVTPVEIAPTRAGILAALRRYANNADNE